VDETSALKALPEPYARALRLRAEGLRDAEIAATLDVPTVSVEPLLRIADAKLAALVGASAQGSPPQLVTGADAP
jgi:DNA-directed RNA polymerase specialized sigma24 family protein